MESGGNGDIAAGTEIIAGPARAVWAYGEKQKKRAGEKDGRT